LRETVPKEIRGLNQAAVPSSRKISRTIGLAAGPLFFAALYLFGDLDPDNRQVTFMAAATLWIGTWWVTEAIPIPATSLLPFVLLPLLGILTVEEAAGTYMTSKIFLFLGGFVIALSMEKWELHRRVALRVIAITGDQPERIVLGFMLASGLLSMWISNTACVMLMLPIALSLIKRTGSECSAEGTDPADPTRRLGLVLMLGIAYGASIGGIATLVGTPPNIVLTDFYGKQFPEGPEISFLTWFLVGFPFSIVFIGLAWGYLVFIACPVRNARSHLNSGAIREEYAKLGPISRQEKTVLVVFITTAVLWFTRGEIKIGDLVFPGWAGLRGLDNKVDDGAVAIAMALLLFMIPSGRRSGERIMDWETTRKLPWGILLLFGGGFALAEGMKQSGLAGWLGLQCTMLHGAPEWLVILSVCLLLTFLTEITSNTATTQMILPVIAPLAVTMGINPLLVMIPAAFSASCAFMLPVATPPNAIVFGSGLVPINRMARTGIVLNLLGAALILLTAKTLLKFFFAIESGVVPAWAAG